MGLTPARPLSLSPAGASPCMGICSVTVGDTVCRGCFRTLDDIARWSTLSAPDLEHILTIRQRVLEQSFTQYFSWEDTERVYAQWQKHIHCPPNPRFAVEAWIQLLHMGASKINDVAAYGVRIQAEHQHKPLREIWRAWRNSLLQQDLFR